MNMKQIGYGHKFNKQGYRKPS